MAVATFAAVGFSDAKARHRRLLLLLVFVQCACVHFYFFARCAKKGVDVTQALARLASLTHS